MAKDKKGKCPDCGKDKDKGKCNCDRKGYDSKKPGKK